MSVDPTALSQLSIFQGVERDLLWELADQSQSHCYEKGEIIIYEGDRFQAKLYAVLEGKILVSKIASSGKETVIRQLPSGEMFAAPALFGDRIAPATVTAMIPTTIVTLEKSVLLQAIQKQPSLALQILEVLNTRIQEMHQTIHDLISERAIVRLSRVIYYSAQRYGTQEKAKGQQLEAKLPYQQLSRMIGITYEECVRLVNKELHEILTYQRGGIITLQDEAALVALISPTFD